MKAFLHLDDYIIFMEEPFNVCIYYLIHNI
jgi:hypothetical protein